MPNLYFTRVSTSLNRTRYNNQSDVLETRRRESIFIQYIVKHHPRFRL
ncbi:arginine deiminase family protein [Staphylococcus aureus]